LNEDLDELLVACSDDMCHLQEPIIASYNMQSVIRKFADNKISLERLLPSMGALHGDQVSLVRGQAVRDALVHKKWTQMFDLVCDVVRSAKIQCLLIKTLEYPWAVLSDIDVLPLNQFEELRALRILEERGFALFQCRLLCHPLKIMALRDDEPAVDFYPSPMWIRKKVCDTELIFCRRKMSAVYKVFVPSSEDSLYLVGSHAYNHLKFTLAEILHGLSVISKSFDWEYVFNLARNYGTLDSIYLYLRLLNAYSEKFRLCSPIDEDIVRAYEVFRVCKRIQSWIDKSHQFVRLPLRIPGTIGCLYSSLYHCRTMSGRVSIPDLLRDFLSHYLMLTDRLLETT
jgi:hypothetical protein